MKVTVYGAGYVGLVTGTCLAEKGHDVLLMDINEAKIASLNGGHIPIYEPGLADLIAANLAANRLQFTTDLDKSVAHGLVQMIAVGTPSDEDGSADVSAVLSVAQSIQQVRAKGESVTNKTEERYPVDRTLIVIKSTVPVGTTEEVGRMFQTSVASNPEFLKEGSAIQDCMVPDRIVVGVDSQWAHDILYELYAPFHEQGKKFLRMDIPSAELTKYAANAMLATKISFINEMSQIAERVGADIESVREGMSLDPRIGPHFINPGCGYGGSCFPKDVRALQSMAQDAGIEPRLLNAVERVNHHQKHVLFKKIQQYFNGDLANITIAVWGLAFKPNTDDCRAASSMTLIPALLAAGANVRAYDPKAVTMAKNELSKIMLKESPTVEQKAHLITFSETSPDAILQDADALVIVTEWDEFRHIDLRGVKKALKAPVVFDGRNLFEPSMMVDLGFEYFAIGRVTKGKKHG